MIADTTRATSFAKSSQWKLVLSAIVTYIALVSALWAAAHHFRVAQTTGGSHWSAIASLAIVLGPYWGFGFGAAAPLRRAMRSPLARVLAPASLVTSYLVFTLPRGEFHWVYFLGLCGIPVAIAALLETGRVDRPGRNALHWQDVICLLLIALPIMLRWFHAAWPHPAMSAIPKLLLTDAALYGYLLVRQLDGVGYDFRPRWRDVGIGLREWALFAPFAIGIGLAIHFIGFHALVPNGWTLLAAWTSTFLLIAIPEELFFRGLLMNLLEPRLGRRGALIVSAICFGFSHFNKRTTFFNWRYVILASMSGIFYGRAWRDRRRLFSSAITHATVDVVWGAWFFLR